uniref:FHF complex subunit HOOK-interacting protein C-terminal domain-containing protein n=1 Tax=Anabas testudineus TaxID=64144 RepID=A0A7N6AJK9_ANATE
METFSKLTSMLLHALETREPTVDLLDSFVEHWKSITNYYIETTDDSRPVKQTDIPWRLKQMLDILVYEEKQQGVEEMGACLEYLLQHKLLETLCTLGKAQYPPGMSQQVLLFFSKLLSQMQQPLLHLVNVYKPVQKLIRLCALPGSQTEKEEAQFLLVICSRVKQDPHTLRYILERGSVCVKAYDSLLLLSGLQSGSSGEILSDQTQLAELLAGRLLELYSLLPVESLDPGQVQSWPHTPWRYGYTLSPHKSSNRCCFPSPELCLCPQVLTAKVSQCVRRLWLVDVVQPQLLLHLRPLCCRQSRPVLVSDTECDSPAAAALQNQCVCLCPQISMVSLSLVDELLQKPHRDILDVLVLSSLQSRSYLSPPATGVDDRHAETSEDGEDLEEDPFFSDSLFSDTQLPPPPPPLSSGLGSTSAVVNSFLCLVPVEVRSAQLLQEGGYESYVHDAHTLVTECQTLSVSWDWPITLPAPASFSGEGEEFFEGHLLKVLFDRLGRILEQPYELNLQLTAVLSRLSSFSHPLLHEYLLNPYIHLSHCSRSLFSVLVRVMAELMQRIQQVSNLTDRLLNARRHLLGLSHNVELEHLTLLRGVIVLEEFCKELAAIAFIKMPLDQN